MLLNERGQVIGEQTSRHAGTSSGCRSGCRLPASRPSWLSHPSRRPRRRFSTRRAASSSSSRTCGPADQWARGFRGGRHRHERRRPGAGALRRSSNAGDGSQVRDKEGLTDSWHQCNLQFTPSIEGLGGRRQRTSSCGTRVPDTAPMASTACWRATHPAELLRARSPGRRRSPPPLPTAWPVASRRRPPSGRPTPA